MEMEMRLKRATLVHGSDGVGGLERGTTNLNELQAALVEDF